MKALEKLIADCKRQGVTFDIRAESVYFSGYTLAFEFTKKSATTAAAEDEDDDDDA
jgi:hypothetical protein